MLNKPVAVAIALLSAAVAPARAEPVKNVVLVHGPSPMAPDGGASPTFFVRTAIRSA
jgi:hypothetical protein